MRGGRLRLFATYLKFALYSAMISSFSSGVAGQYVDGMTKYDSVRHSGQQRTTASHDASVRHFRMHERQKT